MSDTSTDSSVGGGSVAPPTSAPAPAPIDSGGPLTVREASELFKRKAEQSASDAGRTLAEQRNRLRNGTAVSQPQSAPEAPAADESAEAETGSPDGETTDEGQEQASDPDVPAIDPPSSWTKDAQDRWAKLDRETQEYLANRDREDNAAIKRKFQEAEEQLKGVTAREQAIEQQRLQFEAINRVQLEEYQRILQADFSDIQNQADVDKMSKEDPTRWIQWMTHQQKMASKVAVEREAQDRQAQQAQAQFAKFAEEQDKAFVQRMPEFADKEKADNLQKSARKTLKSAGFSDERLARLWNGQEAFSFREAAQQELIAKAAKWDAAQEAKKAVVANKSLPPVQRPGTAQPGRQGPEDKIKWIQKQQKTATGQDAIMLATAVRKLKSGIDVNLSTLRKD